MFEMAEKWTYRRVVAPPEYPGKRYMKKWCLEHHFVWWQHHGELVPKGCIIHHRNGDKADNRIENLELLTNSEHVAGHKAREGAWVTRICGVCGVEFRLRPSKERARLIQSGGRSLFCSRRCAGVRSESGDRKVAHGTPSGYSYHRCRCDVCRAAHTQRHREYRKKSGAVV